MAPSNILNRPMSYFEELLAHDSQYPRVPPQPARTPDNASTSDTNANTRPSTAVKGKSPVGPVMEPPFPFTSGLPSILDLQMRHLRKPSEAFAMEVGEDLDAIEQSNSDGNGDSHSSAPGPDLTRRGIHIPSRTR